jgi:GNAT superfamily N-acetyltransferase
MHVTTRIEPATLEDVEALADLVAALFREEVDFQKSIDPEKQQTGLGLILSHPQKGRIFVIRTDHRILGMVNLLFTISTAEGGHVVLMEDLVIHPEHRGQGLGSQLLQHVIEHCQDRGFKRITLLTDELSARSQAFFARHGFTESAMIPMRTRLKLG